MTDKRLLIEWKDIILHDPGSKQKSQYDYSFGVNYLCLLTFGIAMDFPIIKMVHTTKCIVFYQNSTCEMYPFCIAAFKHVVMRCLYICR